MVKLRSCALPVLILTLALFPALASGAASSSAAAASPGALGFVQAVFDAGLEGAACIALSPDEQYLYVASSIDDAVTVFRRDDSSGRLAFVEVKRDGAGGAVALEGAMGVTVSPDGGHVYVTSWRDDALTVFRRDAAGKLTFVEAHQDEVGGIISLNAAYGVVVSPDGGHVYVASWGDGAVSVFSRDPSTGALTFVEAEGAASGLDETYSLAISPEGKHVYAANHGNDTVTTFERDATTGELTFLGAAQDGVGGVDGLDGAIHVTVSADGANVYVAGAHDHAVAAFQRDAATGALTFVEAEFDDIAGVDGLAGARAVAVSHAGTHVYVAGDDDHAVAIFTRNPTDGALSYAGMVRNWSNGVNEMQSPYWITLDQDDDHLYVASWSYGAVEVFDASAGSLTIIEEQQSGDGLEGAVGVAVGSSGCVYAAGYDDDAVAFFSRDAATGGLTYENNLSADYVDGLNGAVGVAVSPDGWHVYVAGHDDDAVVAFERQPGCSWLEHAATYTDTLPINGLDGARALAFSPDGSLLYVASDVDDAVAIFDRDVGSGALTFRQAVFDSDAGVDGLDGAYAVAASPDGLNFYVTGYTAAAVAVFRWTGGALGYEGVVKDSDPGVDGLDGANSVAVSPDGSYVYVAGRLDDAVAIFWRNPSSGMLTYLGMAQDGVDGVDGLNGARALAISPDGRQVYVASQYDDALAVFERSADDGSLTFAAAYQDGVGGVDGLNTADGVAVSPDGAHVYVAGYDDDALAVLARFRVYLPLVIRN
jgi:6-phosphogluconolactonase (cycloisomerase 2 family)